eukprot:403365331
MTKKGTFSNLIFLSVAATITISSFINATDVVFKTGEPQYMASYSVDNSNPDAPELQIQLELMNYDITAWFQYNQTVITTNTTDANGTVITTTVDPNSNTPLPGVMMGLGLGSQMFGNSDLIVCNFTQDLDLTKNAFDCFDYRVDENGTVVLDEQQDVRAVFTVYPFTNRTITTNIETTNPDTNEVTTTTLNNTKADIIVTFVRTLNTSDSTDFTLGQTIVDAYWVFGPISGNELNITQHLENAEHFGATQLDLTPVVLGEGHTDNHPGSGALALMSQTVALVAAFSLFIFQ